MIGIYFSGTGNTKYCVETFVTKYDREASSYSIEDRQIENYIQGSDVIVFGYPVQYSNVPKFVKDFINNHSSIWKNKRIFVIATMGLFSGDGAGILARLLKKHEATIIGGLHVVMPDSICDEKVLKRTFEKNKALVYKAKHKISYAVEKLEKGSPTKQGIHLYSRIFGFFGQRLYFINKTKHYVNSLNIDASKCIGCSKCVKLCPTKNLLLKEKNIVSTNTCTLCYRCANNCPQCAITLLGNKVRQQTTIEKYL